jgi:hypothetical protein
LCGSKEEDVLVIVVVVEVVIVVVQIVVRVVVQVVVQVVVRVVIVLRSSRYGVRGVSSGINIAKNT